MNIIIDTNVVLSALIKDSITRHLIVSLNISFYYPELSFDEIIRNKDGVLEKGDMTNEEFNRIMIIVFKYINIIKTEELEAHLKKADNIIGHIHKNDVIFIVAALAKNAVIWSNDTHFQKQDRIFIVTTKDIVTNYRKVAEKFHKVP